MKENAYLRWLSANTQSVYWHDSAILTELEMGISNGARGMTTNPFLIGQTLSKTPFKTVYKLLIDKEQGPRLYLFLYAIEAEKYLPLLDFSTPKTEAETAPVAVEEVVEEKPAKVYGDPDPVAPVKDELEIDSFDRIDLRVCQVVKCSEIRKSHSCLKLVLDDGISQRTIVSSIKSEYKPEDLIGKKIIVLANLKPARFAGVTSEGMLLAATNNACGCKVIFVDDSVPEGTAIH